MTKPTSYYRPQTFDEALRYLAHPGAMALSGGALLLGTLALRHDSVIDLQDIAELKRVEVDEHHLTLGAGLRLQDVVESDHAPLALKRAVTRAVPLNIRNGTSVGESLLVARPPAEWLTVLIALGTTIEFAGPGADDRTDEPLLTHINNPHRQPVQRLITGLVVPVLPPGAAIGTAYVARTPADEPLVAAAVRVGMDGTRRVAGATIAVAGASANLVARGAEPGDRLML